LTAFEFSFLLSSSWVMLEPLITGSPNIVHVMLFTPTHDLVPGIGTVAAHTI